MPKSGCAIACVFENEDENEEENEKSTRQVFRSGTIGIDRQVRLSIVNQPSDC